MAWAKDSWVKGDFGSQRVAGNPIGQAKPLGSVQFTDPLRSNTLGLPESFVVVWHFCASVDVRCEIVGS